MSKRFIIVLAMLFMLSLAGWSASAQGPSISILNPLNGQILPASGPFTVTGTAIGLFENNLVVQALDSSGSVLAQQAVTTDAVEVGGPGFFNVTLTISGVTSGSPGTIYAYATSAADGSVIASASVSITYGPVLPPPVSPAIDVVVPAPGTVLPIGSPFTVSGTGSNWFETLPVVRALGPTGAVLAEQPIPIDASLATGAGSWSVSLTVSGVAPGSTGRIVGLVLNPMTNAVIASDEVNVVYGQAGGTPRIIIVNPQPNQVLDTSIPVRVSGTSENLYQGNLTIVATNNNNQVLAQVNTTASSGPTTEGPGGWQVDLNLQNVPRGTPGRISAYSYNASGGVAASASVNVIFGQQVSNPSIVIFSPANNTTVYTDRPIRVTGAVANVVNGTVVVQAQDANGVVLAQQITGGTNWLVDLVVTVAPGTRGSIFAYVTAPTGGPILAQARVFVTFGGPCVLRTDWPTYVVVAGDTLSNIARRVGSTVSELARANCLSDANLLYVGQVLRVPRLPALPPVGSPEITIFSPQPGAVLNIGTAIPVNGSARGLLQGFVIVRAVDRNGVVLAQQSAVVNAPSIGGQGSWQANLLLNVRPGTPGSIYVFSTSPADNSIVADTIVDVIFGQAVASQPSIKILSPQAHTSVAQFNPLAVSGTSSGIFEGGVIVRVLDALGAVLAELPAASDAGGNWQVSLPLNVLPGTRGMIFAYALSVEDGSIIAADGVNVVFGPPAPGPFVTIDGPLPYSILNIDENIVIGGRGGGLFENSFVVRVTDSLGKILAEEPATTNATQPGGVGQWEIGLPIVVQPGTRGVIQAFTISPEDGSIQAMTMVKVIFGDVRQNNRFVHIVLPLPDTPVDLARGIALGGFAGGALGDQIQLVVKAANGQGLMTPQTAQVSSVDPQTRIGVWQATLVVPELQPGTAVSLVAYITSPADGRVIAIDEVPVVQAAAPGAVEAIG